MNRFFKIILRTLITVASVVGFFGGWAALAHSRKPLQPVQLSNPASLPPLQPIPSLNGSSNFQPVAPVTRQRGFGPAFMTGGS